jgi:hypothetical protein
LATAEDDTDPGVSDLMQWLSTFSTDARTKFARYKTGGHGVEMFAAHPELPATIVDWVTIAVRSPNVATAKGAPNVSPKTQFLDSLDQPGAAANSAQLYAAASGKNPNGPVVSELVLNRSATIIFRTATKRARSLFSSSTPACTPIHPMFTTASATPTLPTGRTIWRGRMRRRPLSCWRTTPPIPKIGARESATARSRS